MSSDEKTGFLIGLIFILVVAWALNGVPHYSETANSNELTAVMVTRPAGIRPGLQEFFSPQPAQGQSVSQESTSHYDRKVVRKAPPAQSYVVQEGDTLWKIAARLLGEGRRYKEITALNPGLLNNENSLTVGAQLIVPSR